MKKQISLIIFGLLAIGTAFSQTSIWEISKNGNALYLAGSVHLLRAEDYPLPEMFDKIFEKSDILVFETDMSQLKNPEVAQKMMTQATLPGEETLQTILNEETFKLLEEKAAELSLPLQNMLKLKPAMIVNFLTIMKLQQIGFMPQGVDTHFYDKATEQNMEVDFLETVDEQINMLVNMGTGYENEFVKYSLDDLDNTQTYINKIILDWRNGTSEFVSSMLTEMNETFPTVYESLIIERNNNWMPQLEKYLTNKPVEFVIVGLAHLHGKDGLLSELKRSGYMVKRLK